MSKELIEALDRARSLLLELSRLDYTSKEKARFNADAALLQAHRDAIASGPVAFVVHRAMVGPKLDWFSNKNAISNTPLYALEKQQ